jgi:hypothetical protein
MEIGVYEMSALISLHSTPKIARLLTIWSYYFGDDRGMKFRMCRVTFDESYPAEALLFNLTKIRIN